MTIYTTPSCVYCGMAKKLFAARNVPFTERDVLHDLSARAEMEKKSGQLGVPVIEIGNLVFVGFDRVALERALGIERKKSLDIKEK